MYSIMDQQLTVIGKETYGSHNTVKKSYVQARDGRVIIIDNSEKYTSVTQFFRSVFLPQGYPDSVSDDYVTYQIWDTIQAFASSITGALAAEQMLSGLGVGKANASTLGAAMTWIIRHGTGMTGSILFAWARGTSLDCDCKRWRLFADIVNDFSIFLEILAPTFGSYFIVVVCAAGVGKSLVGVAAGATRAALTLHQARRDNMADVAAKDGSQETLVNLAGLICSLIILPVVSGKPILIWILYIIFTSIHLYANYSAVTCVVMETLNQSRLKILIQNYLQTGEVLPLKAVNYAEPVIWSTRRRLKIRLGAPLSSICKSVSDVQIFHEIYETEEYLLAVDFVNNCINIVLRQNASMAEQLKACVQAEIINFAAEHSNKSPDTRLDQISWAYSQGDLYTTLHQSYQFTHSIFSQFIKELHEHHWITDHARLCADEWRTMWDFSGMSVTQTL